MKTAGKFVAMLLRRWGSKTPKRAKTTQYIVAGIGTTAFIVLSIPSLGLPIWASLGVGLLAATSIAYEQIKDETNKTVIKESKEILKD